MTLSERYPSLTYRCPVHDHLLVHNFPRDTYECSLSNLKIPGEVLHYAGPPTFAPEGNDHSA